MHSSKLINLLSCFSKKEIKSFKSFLISPYHNTNNELVLFFDYIKQSYPGFTSTKLTKKETFKYLYPENIYKDKHIRYLMSDLLKLVNRFLLVQRIESKGIEGPLQLMDEFINRKKDKPYQQIKTQLKLNYLKNKVKNVDYFFNKIKIIDLEVKYSLQHQNRMNDDKAQQGSDVLNRYYSLKKLKYACSMLNRQTLLKESYNLSIPENWISWLESNHYWNEKIIELYTNVFLVFKNPNDPIYFERFLDLLQNATTNISQEDLRELFLYAINYCLRKMREGKKIYVEKALSLYREGIKTEALLENGRFSPQSFNNVVKIALRLQKYNWIERFIEEYSHFLPPASKENTLRYNLAELNCYKKDFNRALRLLSKVEFVDISYQLGSRIMLSKIYFELKEEAALLSLISSFMMFLKRNRQISDPIRKTCLNFCDLLFLIIRGKTDDIEDKIKNTPLLADRNWLLEKVAQARSEL